MIKVIYGIIMLLIRLIIKIIKVIKRQISKSFFSFIDLIQLILSFLAIIIWMRIIFTPDFNLTKTLMDVNAIAVGNELAYLQEKYLLYQHMNSFLTLIRLMQFLAYSQRLSAFADILSSAKYDIIFFVIMFAYVTYFLLLK